LPRSVAPDVVSAVAALLSALAGMVLTPNLNLTRTRTVEAIPNASLVPPWKLHVTVENGNGDISWTRTVASRVGAMGYTIAKVGRADRFIEHLRRVVRLLQLPQHPDRVGRPDERGGPDLRGEGADLHPRAISAESIIAFAYNSIIVGMMINIFAGIFATAGGK